MSSQITGLLSDLKDVVPSLIMKKLPLKNPVTVITVKSTFTYDHGYDSYDSYSELYHYYFFSTFSIRGPSNAELNDIDGHECKPEHNLAYIMLQLALKHPINNNSLLIPEEDIIIYSPTNFSSSDSLSDLFSNVKNKLLLYIESLNKPSDRSEGEFWVDMISIECEVQLTPNINILLILKMDGIFIVNIFYKNMWALNSKSSANFEENEAFIYLLDILDIDGVD